MNLKIVKCLIALYCPVKKLYLKNASHSSVNVFVNEKNLSESRRMHSLPFYIIAECFLPDWKTFPYLDRKRPKVFHQPIKWAFDVL
jgi:hypothetical protein